MNNFLSIINEKYKDKYSFLRLGYVKISVSERKANITFLVPEDIYDYGLKTEDVNEIKETLKETLGSEYTIFCRFEKIILTEESVKSALVEHMSKHFPLIAANLDFSKLVVKIEDELFLRFSTQKNIRDYMEGVSFDKRIKDYFLEKYAMPVELDFDVCEDEITAAAAPEARAKAGRYGKSVEVTDKVIVMGKISDLHAPAVHISTLKGEGEDAICCGKISYLAFKTRDESRKEEYKKFFKHYYTFSITDTTGYLNIFLNTDVEYPLLQNGAEVVCRGRVNARDESTNLSMYVKSIATCKIPFSLIEEQTKPLDPPQEYSVLVPKEFHEVSYDQLGFDFLRDNRPVAHHSAASGVTICIRSLKSERFFVPYEIAMCEVEGGKIERYLHTYLKVAFTDDSEKAAFANQKGYSSPRLSTVIPDLIKFTAGKVLVGLNPTASMDLLNVTAKPLRYLFRNDVHVVAPTALEEDAKKGDALNEAVAIAHAFIAE